VFKRSISASTTVVGWFTPAMPSKSPLLLMWISYKASGLNREGVRLDPAARQLLLLRLAIKSTTALAMVCRCCSCSALRLRGCMS
jgi:hypothetical protein